jgi:solute:Na+ symporter, SSS family
VHPGGPGWRPIAERAGGPPPERIGGLFIDWAAGWILIYAVLFCIGSLVLGSFVAAVACTCVAVVCAVVIARDLSRRGWKTIAH